MDTNRTKGDWTNEIYADHSLTIHVLG